MAIKISLSTPKGGVGKTTTAVNLGAELALQGYETIIVDVDEQRNATLHLNAVDAKVNVIDLFEHRATVGAVTRESPLHRLYIIPSTTDLAAYRNGLEKEMMGREFKLRKALAKIESFVDFILIDCPPSTDMMTINALTASDYIIAVTEGEVFSLDSARRIEALLHDIHDNTNPDLALLGILLNRHNPNRKLSKDIIHQFRTDFPDLLFAQSIRTDVALAEAPAKGKPIQQYKPSSNGAKDFHALTLEILSRLNVPAVRK